MDFSIMADAFLALMEPTRLLLLFAGVLLGLFMGAMPGVGGIAALATLLPFVIMMDTTSAIALMIGLMISGNTGDTLPAVLFGIPGSGASQATILDGHPLARKGEAARALGAAYLASMIGGILGAIILTLTLHVIKPFILSFGTPELFMLGLLGISMTGTLARGAPAKGLIAGCLGLLLATIGYDPLTANLRWTFGTTYLYDGLPLIVVALGIFALPEIVDLAIRGQPIAENTKIEITGSLVQGMRDTLHHWFLVLRTSIVGIIVGILPGLGGSVTDWFAYSHALQTEKGAKDTFGKGDIRGVIGVDAATNSKEGGALIPTLALGIPGSTSMAFLLYLFTMHGIPAGPRMLINHPDIILTIAWSVALANIMSTGVMLVATTQTAKIALIPFHWLVPLISVFIMFGVYQASLQAGDITALMTIGIFGWLMKRFGWPRPPLILGFVLSPILEKYLEITLVRYGIAFVTRPLVLIIALFILFSVYIGVKHSRRQETMEHQHIGDS